MEEVYIGGNDDYKDVPWETANPLTVNEGASSSSGFASVHQTQPDSSDLYRDDSAFDGKYMEMAISQARLSQPVPTAYCVGAVLVSSSGQVLATGFSRELPGNTHAEECCLLKLSVLSLADGATMYTTMEPCGERLSGNVPCAQRIVEANISRVVMGVKEPPNFIAACQGTKFLTDHGVIVDYLGGYEQECLAPNKHIVQGPALTSFSLNSNDALRISISDPEKHGEGSSAFVSYAVTTKTLLDSFPRAEMSSRRRFQDFVWLNKTLTEDFPAVIIPPLPGKHRMEYITGDRFSPEFIEKRRLSLQTYMDRLSRHPILQTSKALRRFLETGDLVSSDLSSTKSRDSHVFENISDAFINAFAKVRKPDERFLEFKESVEKFEDNLNTVEKLHTKLLRQQHELERDTLEFAQCMRTLGDMETQITDPLADASESLRKICTLMKERSERDEMTFVGGVQEYAAYCQSVKEVLKLRDQKQVDYEELEGYLENYTADRDRTLQGRNGGGIAGFIKDKYNDFRNVNHEQARQTKLHKLEARISELREAAEQSSEISAAFSHEVIKELDLFQQGKIIDFKEFLRDYTESQMEFHQKGIKVWDEIIPIIESMDSATTSESI